jgi:aminoglycoside phosphotransferase family enzyme/predicted kinase
VTSRRASAPPGAPPTPEALARALQAATAPPVELRETHVSWVLLTEDHAYKLKKPVAYAFVDQSTPEHRRWLCEEEVRVNRALAPDVVLGVRAVVEVNSGYALAPADTPRAVDWVVAMRRFDERRTMAALAARDELTDAQVDAAAVRIAHFHRDARRVRIDLPAVVRAASDRNFEELVAAAREIVPGARLLAAERLADAFLTRRAPLLAERARAGHVVDGHGDLRAEHVLLREDGITIVDRLEFDPALRHVDVADDLAFLVMDLEAHGCRRAADALVHSYRAAGGDPGDDALIAFYAAYRAQVRAKVALLAERYGQAQNLLDLGERLQWRARGPLLLLVTGPPASGKTTLARAVGEASGFPVLSSDALRPGRPGDADRYTLEHRARVYADLAHRAGPAVAAHGGAIVDATFGEVELQERFLGALDPGARAGLRVVECRAPFDERLARAERRSGDASEADRDVAAMLADRFVPMPAAHRLVVEPGGGAALVADWIDETL